MLVGGGAAGVCIQQPLQRPPASVSATAGACVSVRILSSLECPCVGERGLASIWLLIPLIPSRIKDLCFCARCLQNDVMHTCKHGDPVRFARAAGALPRTRWPSSQHLRFPSGRAQVQEGQPQAGQECEASTAPSTPFGAKPSSLAFLSSQGRQRPLEVWHRIMSSAI